MKRAFVKLAACLGLIALAGRSPGANPAGVEVWVQVTPSVSLTGSLALLGPTTLSVGQSVLATLTVTNAGGSAATNLTAGLWRSFGSGAATISGPTPATWASLAPAATVTFTFTLTATTPGSVAWTATTTADGPVSSVGAVTPVVTVQPKAVLTATPSTSWASVCPGGLYQYTLTVGNAAAAAQATGVTPTARSTGPARGSARAVSDRPA